MTPTLNETAQRFLARADQFAAIIDGVGDQAEAPTPCDGWTVRDVVQHAVETERAFFDQRDLSLEAQPDLTDLAAGWRRHAADAIAVLARDGVAEQEYDGYFGRTTIAATVADFYGWDLVIHGWDIARATGQEWSLPEDEVAAMNATADTWGAALHSEGVCGPEVSVADDAPTYEKLLGRLGRDPNWKA